MCSNRAGADRNHEDLKFEELGRRLVERIVKDLGKPLTPKAIEFAKDLPKTRNAKVLRRVIRGAYLGEALGDTSSLENPAAVEEVRGVAAPD